MKNILDNRSILYSLIRPFITRGEILDRQSVLKDLLVEEAMKLERLKYSNFLIMKYYYRALETLINQTTITRPITHVVDIGSSTGKITAQLALRYSSFSFIGIEIMEQAVTYAQGKYRAIKNLRFEKSDFIHSDFNFPNDLILCLQTLEHIRDDQLEFFTKRLFRVAKKAVILSVPREPNWCLANLLRLKYWSRLGNSPHHLQHWSKDKFEKFIKKTARQEWGDNISVSMICPLKLWTLALVTNNGIV